VTVRVLLADDDQLIRAGLRALLTADPEIEVVGEASDGELAVYLARRVEPDVVLMDIRMPRLDGIAATRRIAEGQPGVRMVVLTTFALDEYVYDALRAGASGFLLKDAPADLLRHAVHAAARGEAMLSPRIASMLIAPLAARHQRDDPPAGYDELTPRERDVLGLLARGWSNTEIADDLGVSEATIKSHVTPLLAKLGLRDRAQAIVLAHEHGLVQRGPPEPKPPTAGTRVDR
jgi:DNA-binding NarL/FixJ family response regulator